MAFLELIDIRKSFAQSTAVERFNLNVERGEFVSFLGPSGCGKTTTLRMIAGFETPTSGEIHIDGQDITHKAANHRPVGMVFQSYALFPNMKVADNIAFGLTIAKQPKAAIKQRVDEMLALIHLEPFAGRYPYQLSGGQQQRVALARAIAIRPQVLLLDEPLSALDAKIRVELRHEIRSIQQKLGITTIYVTHDQEEALSLSDRIVVMSAGRVEQIGTPFEIYNFPTTEFAAQFVGTLNTLQTRVRSAAEGRLTVDGQEIQLAHGLDGAREGDELAVSLRPERVSLAGETRKANVLTATVQNIMFLGSIVRIHVQTGANAFYLDEFTNPHLTLPKLGAQVQVTFSREAPLVLKRSS